MSFVSVRKRQSNRITLIGTWADESHVMDFCDSTWDIYLLWVCAHYFASGYLRAVDVDWGDSVDSSMLCAIGWM